MLYVKKNIAISQHKSVKILFKLNSECLFSKFLDKTQNMDFEWDPWEFRFIYMWHFFENYLQIWMNKKVNMYVQKNIFLYGQSKNIY